MPNDLVRWNDLHPIFSAIFPNTVRDVMDNSIPRAPVVFFGHTFEIRPRPGLPHDFDVWGPPTMEMVHGDLS